LSIFAMPGASATVAGTVEVKNLPSGSSVVLSGIVATGDTVPSLSKPGLRLSNNAGHVRFQSSSFIGGAGAYGQYPGGTGGRGVEIQDCGSVAFVDCVLRGGDGYGSQCYDCHGGHGGDGVYAGSANVALYGCSALGGKGGSVGEQGGNGGAGYRAISFGLFAAGSSFVGGRGGNADDFIVAFGGAGGDGLFLNGAQAKLLENTYTGGAGGVCIVFPNHNGPAGQAIVNNGGFLKFLLGSARRLESAPIAGDASSLSLTVHGELGDRVFLHFARVPGFLYVPAFNGTWLIPFSGFLGSVPAGVIPASGTLTLAVPVADLPASRLAVLQAHINASSGDSYLTNAVHVALLDRAAQPDCNGNGSLDYVDLIEGSAGDCNVNLRPDTCDIASGAIPDCNSNSVPDSCDIAAGTSLDINHNGIPDECEFTYTTWFVDASAPPGGNGSALSPFQTIQQGIAASFSSDTVLVRDGVYVGPQNRALDFGGKNIVVKSQNGPANCIIDCQAQDRAFWLHSNEPPTARIEGFAIVNGRSTAQGGGILMQSSNATIANCVLSQCFSGYGGGAAVFGGLVRFDKCIFSANAANNAAGLVCTGWAVIRSCQFLDNVASFNGGGLLVGGPETIVVSHTRFFRNRSSTGAAVYNAMNSVGGSSFGQGLFIDDCLIAGNAAQQRGGALASYATPINGQAVNVAQVTDSTLVDNSAGGYGGAVLVEYPGSVVLANSILWGNTAGAGAQIALVPHAGTLGGSASISYCDLQGGLGAVYVQGGTLTAGAGNITVLPAFVDPDGPDNDPSTVGDNDYRLSLASPCIDAADNHLVPLDRADIDDDNITGEVVPWDLDYLPRFVEIPSVPNTGSGAGAIVDMGAFERQP
jgi:hypothetical protein